MMSMVHIKFERTKILQDCKYFLIDPLFSFLMLVSNIRSLVRSLITKAPHLQHRRVCVPQSQIGYVHFQHVPHVTQELSL